MPTTYRATLTEVGAALVADAIASGTTLTWAKMALGDGSGSAVTVDPSRTSLVNEQYRAPLNDLGRDSANPNTIVGTLVVPPETGGWTIREFGIYDNAATPRLVAYGETPEIEKPASSAGTGINLRLRFKLIVSAEANITLAPDSNEAYATIEYVKDNAVKSLSVSGRTITYTMGDGDTHTIKTQDTTYDDATQSEHGLMSVTDKKKLDGIAAAAEVNQNAFSNFKVGNVTVAADSKTDTLVLVAGTGITLTPDATNDKVTIKVTDNTYADMSHTHAYLPLSGGTMTGPIHTSYTNFIDKTTDQGYLFIKGVPVDKHGGSLSLQGWGNDIPNPGGFYLRSQNSNGVQHSLTGTNQGDLLWDNKKIITINDIVTTSVAGVMSSTDKAKLDKIIGKRILKSGITGDSYYKVKIDDIIALSGHGTTSNNASSYLSFPEAFPTACFTVFATPMYWDSQDVISMHTNNITKTGCNLWSVFHYLSGSQMYVAREYCWIAFGR